MCFGGLLAAILSLSPQLFAEEKAQTSISSGVTTSYDPAGRTLIFSAPSLSADSGVVTWVGLRLDEISRDVSTQLPIDPGTGLIVRSVEKDSPAVQAGLQENDVLCRLDDQILVNPAQFRALIRNKAEGDQITVSYLRKGAANSATLTLAKREEHTVNNVVANSWVNSDWQAGAKKTILFNNGKPVLLDEQRKALEEMAKRLYDQKAQLQHLEEIQKGLSDSRKSDIQAIISQMQKSFAAAQEAIEKALPASGGKVRSPASAAFPEPPAADAPAAGYAPPPPPAAPPVLPLIANPE